MDKTIYKKQNIFKLFGKKIYESIEYYEGMDLTDVEPINPAVFLEVNLNDEFNQN